MRIVWKIYLSLALLVSFLLLTIAIAYNQSGRVDYFRSQAANSQNELKVMTDLRAKVRQRIVANSKAFNLLIMD